MQEVIIFSATTNEELSRLINNWILAHDVKIEDIDWHIDESSVHVLILFRHTS